MGFYSYFVRVTGNCRIMLSKLRKITQECPSTPLIVDVLNEIIDRKIIQIDQDGEEFVVLEEIGKIMSGWKVYGYLNTGYIRYFYALYECMSIDGMSCYESKIKVEEVDDSVNVRLFSQLDKDMLLLRCGLRYKHGMELQNIEGYLKESNNSFENIESLKRSLQPFIDNPFANPVMKFSQRIDQLHDISIITTSSGMVDSYENVKKKRKFDNEPCKLYFIGEERAQYFYFEFLRFGDGIKFGVISEFPYVKCQYELGEDVELYYDEIEKINNEIANLISKTKDEAFTWKILPFK